MYKRYYYHILIFLLVSNLEKSHESFHSRVQSSLNQLTTRDFFALSSEIFVKHFYDKPSIMVQIGSKNAVGMHAFYMKNRNNKFSAATVFKLTLWAL